MLPHSLVYGGQNQNRIINKNRIALLCKKQFFKEILEKDVYLLRLFCIKGEGLFLKGGDARQNKLTTE